MEEAENETETLCRKHFQDQGHLMCSVHHCDEDRKIQTMSETEEMSLNRLLVCRVIE